MIKKIVFSVVILLVLSFSGFSVYMMYNGDNSKSLEIDPEQITLQKPDIFDREERMVTRGIVEDYVEFQGVVSNNDSVLKEITIATNGLTLQITKGDVFSKDDIIYTVGKNEVKSTAKMKCMDIKSNKDNTTISLLDFSQTFITAKIPTRAIDKAPFDRVIKIIVDENEYDGKVTYIDYINNDGYFDCTVEFNTDDFQLYPNTKVKLKMILEQKNDVLYLPLHYIIDNNGSYQVHSYDSETCQFTYYPVELGLIGYENVEIISGVQEKLTLLSPEINQSLYFTLNRTYLDEWNK